MDKPYVARSAPETSHQAAEKVAGRTPAIRHQIEAWAVSLGLLGFTDEDLYDRFHRVPVNTLRPRRRELAQQNILLDSGRRLKNSAGNDCVLWVHRSAAHNPPPVVELPKAPEKPGAKAEREAILRLGRTHLRCQHHPNARVAVQSLIEQIEAGTHHI